MNHPHDASTEVTQPSGAGTEVVQSDKFADPGVPAHKRRLTDIDPRSAKRNERIVTLLFVLSCLGAVGMIVAYVAVPPEGTTESVRTSTLLLGVGMAVSLLGIGIAGIHWAKALMGDAEMVQDRHPIRSSDEVRADAVRDLNEGLEDSGVVGRRGVLKGAALSALALFPLTIAVPLIGSVGGDWNVSKFKHTMWKKGTRLAIDPSGRPIKASDVNIGSAFHVIPETTEEYRESHEWITEKSKAVVLMVRVRPEDLKSDQSPEGEQWSYDGIVAYSKICTHVGCPVALYEQQTHHLLCPCHQSTFDVADSAKVVFGPAKRPLPQLPITVDDEGYLVAQDDFAEPIGPSFWERLK
ncbi:ubiquinol-cytochrome c reductase iron-sulfur subunit [Myceligenerans pegani]|uniref:Cytochrome bc1 complex Rieske iron-sulfur subunit n=1 Tax=Myceligenerans pegani TaxID=2776917 RepID=A0ABR9N292_9MICO|nr:Rieske 2Fe-2S domain-containing protein [Myceligenerans sp. TRM 65318]MBE1877223.1 Rieske 2Fe-2S domain-containing protein [Myceligenerans sp. TRM 65318]MBE3019494.1 Rieske 2Fe-2S domain-containing protein [Myceligenerans sp. TRM 65318]